MKPSRAAPSHATRMALVFGALALCAWAVALGSLRAAGAWVGFAGALIASALCAWGYIAVKRALESATREPAGRLARAVEERDRMRAVLDVMAEGVLLVRPDGTILHANRALRQMFVGRKKVFVAGSGQQMQIPDMRELIGMAVRSRLTRVGELNIEGPRGRVIQVRATPLDDATTGMVCVLSDVTDLRHLERVRRDFVANVSHELRTPIAAIRAAVETLQGGAAGKPDAAPKFLAVIERQSQRVQGLMEDLLELSRIEAHEVKVTAEKVQLADVVDDALEALRPVAEKRNVSLVADVQPDAAVALADASALDHVLTNLIDNAIKYSRDGARVCVATRATGNTVRISVSDNGPGIAPEHLPRLFERFYRVDSGRSREVGGTGLGLAIVKHLTERMNGSVSVDSEPGKGSAFHVDLPAG